MASRNKDERAFVNALTKAIQKNSHRVYVYIDRDAGAARHTSSGFDFILLSSGRVVFCEAKVEKGKLSEWQEFVRADIKSTHSRYVVIRFYEDGKVFTVDGGKQIETELATFADIYGAE